MIDTVGKNSSLDQSVYLVTEEKALTSLIKMVRGSALVLGKDVGIIAYNESLCKELLDITVVTTDFKRMGRTAAELILGKQQGICRNPFYTIHRASF